MKELWLELDPKLPNDKKGKLLSSASEICDTVLVEPADVDAAKKAGNKTASVGGTVDITVLPVFDSEKVKELKSQNKT
ncbi:MAG: hypothetical protein NWF03_03780, partial [Candidatus Bathyarchaeota archaeon]|nr:hypothetical protein [Candidatus Bathyarchaeota archaeon]